jgi:hypothetical protein
MLPWEKAGVYAARPIIKTPVDSIHFVNFIIHVSLRLKGGYVV